jgi:uncharacterized membrane protein SpoIIM required for sporulation
MIVDIQKFITSERPIWKDLEAVLNKIEKEPSFRMKLSEIQHFHYLYRRTSADLAKISSFASEQEIRTYLESLVAKSYGEIHEIRKHARTFNVLQWFTKTFPQTFRRNIRSFNFSLLITLIGVIFGGAAISFDPSSKAILMPFSHLQGSPAERVKEEESQSHDRLEGNKSRFSTHLMTHNTQVSIFTLGLGATWGIGTFIMLFYNGVILGAVALDYILAGQSAFLFGWLMPHGVIEIPAILIAGQGGFLLASAMIGWESRLSMRSRLRTISNDLVTLIGGAGSLLIWAGFVESFLSQYHEPVIPYFAKITFGSIELVLLCLFLGLAGKKKSDEKMIEEGISS